VEKVRRTNSFFHPEAEKELNEAINDYEDIEPGLGYDFALEVHSKISRSVDFPEAWPAFAGDVRRSLVRRFPYGVFYSEESVTRQAPAAPRAFAGQWCDMVIRKI